MTATMIAGCVLVAYSVPFAFFCLLIARKPVLLVVCLISAGFCLGSLFVSSIIWRVIPSLQESKHAAATLVISTTLVELTRVAFLRIYARAERGFAAVSTNAIVFPMTDLYSGLGEQHLLALTAQTVAAAGVGFGVTSTALIHGAVLASARGPGTHFSPECPEMSTIQLTAWYALCFNIMHICWMVISLDGLRIRGFYRIVFVVAAHLFAALSTMVSKRRSGCIGSLTLVGVTTLASVTAMAWVIRQPLYRSRKRSMRNQQ